MMKRSDKSFPLAIKETHRSHGGDFGSRLSGEDGDANDSKKHPNHSKRLSRKR